jgi:bilirubin oxidase
LLAPAQRADIVVRAPMSVQQTVTVRTVAYNRGMGIAVKPGEVLFRLTTSAEPAVPAFAMPLTLPSPAAVGAAQRTQAVVLNDVGMGMGMGMGGSFTINGRVFEPGRDDLTMRAGVPEEWIVRNDGMMDHPLHIHGCAFQLVSSTRSDIASDPRLGAFMDTVNLRPGETLRLRVQIDTPGRRMLHCHILEHEDQGMMAIVNVLPLN